MYILPAKLEQNERQSAAAKIDQLVQKAKGVVLDHTEWLSRKLSYPIKHIRQGNFMLAHLSLPEEQMAQLLRELRLAEEILRFQLVKVDEYPTAKSLRRPQTATLPQPTTATHKSKAESEKVEVAVSPEQLAKKLEEILGDKESMVK